MGLPREEMGHALDLERPTHATGLPLPTHEIFSGKEATETAIDLSTTTAVVPRLRKVSWARPTESGSASGCENEIFGENLENATGCGPEPGRDSASEEST